MEIYLEIYYINKKLRCFNESMNTKRKKRVGIRTESKKENLEEKNALIPFYLGSDLYNEIGRHVKRK